MNYRVLHAAFSGHRIYPASDITVFGEMQLDIATYMHAFHSIITTKPLMQQSKHITYV